MTVSDPYGAYVELRPIESGGSTTVAFKDNIHVPGFMTRLGMDDFGLRPEPVSEVYLRLTDLGMKCNGKLATTEFCLGVRPPGINPRHPALTPGGSSTGCGIAVAASMCDLAVGTDSGGSLRWPAVYCEVVGLRLTHDARLLTGVVALSPTLESIGLVARSAAGLKHLWEDLGAGFALSGAVRRPTASRRRWVVPVQYRRELVDPQIDGTFRRLVQRLRVEGEEVEERSLPWWSAREAAWRVLLYEAATLYGRLAPTGRELRDPGARAAIAEGTTIASAAYRSARSLTMSARRCHDAAHERCTSIDLTLLPLDARLPWRVDSESPVAVVPLGGGRRRGRRRHLRFTIGASLLGAPAVALTVGHAAEGAPIGVQLMGPRQAEFALLDAAVWLEQLVQRDGFV